MAKSKGSTQVLIRMNIENLTMLDNLCKAYNNNRAVIMRMAMKLLHDRTFKPKKESP